MPGSSARRLMPAVRACTQAIDVSGFTQSRTSVRYALVVDTDERVTAESWTSLGVVITNRYATSGRFAVALGVRQAIS